MVGVSYLEFFGIGVGAERGVQAARDALEGAGSAAVRGRVRLGLQPHAPNTVSLGGYDWAAREAAARGMPLCTHAAETPEEIEFVARATGPQRTFLESLGLWSDTILGEVGLGRTPIRHLEPVLERAPITLVHANAVSGEDLELLSRVGARVVYCPRASEYFGAPDRCGPHRYREMVKAGVHVALGTDSIINLPTSAADPAQGGISVLDEIRFLYQRDRTDPRLLLRMATIYGAETLGIPLEEVLLTPGARPLGVVAVPCEAGRDSDLYGCLCESSAPPKIVWTGISLV